MTYTDLILTTHPERDVLATDGAGSTESPAFGAAIGALYAAQARLGGGDAPLEGTYWQRGGGEFDLERADDWEWTLATPLPEGAETFDGADGVRLIRLPAIRVVQAEHHGSYAEETRRWPHCVRRRPTAAWRSAARTPSASSTTRARRRQSSCTLLWYPVMS